MKFKCVWTSAVLTKGYALPGIFVGGLVAVLEDGRYLSVSDSVVQESQIYFLEEACEVLDSAAISGFADTIRKAILEFKLDRITADFADSDVACKPWKMLPDGCTEAVLEENMITRIRERESGNNPALPVETINLVNGDSINIYDSQCLRTIDEIAKKILEILEDRRSTNPHPLNQTADNTRWMISLMLGQWYAYDISRVINAL